MRFILLIIALLGFEWGHAQETYSCQPITDLENWGQGFVCGKRNDQLLYRIQSETGLISDVSDAQTKSVVLCLRKGATWMDYPNPPLPLVQGFNADYDFGVLSGYSDSLVAFALPQFTVVWPEGTIVTGKIFNQRVDELKAETQPPQGSRFIHPALSPDGSQIVFASDMPGGQGGFDLYYINRIGDEWSVPVSLGNEVNTPGNEVFPSWNGNDLCFSSTGHIGKGGMDVYKTSPSTQWKEVTPFPEPFNSPNDDFLPVWLSDEVCVLNSDRNGRDQAFRIAKVNTEGNHSSLTALLECKGTGVENAQVTIENSLGEIVINDVTSASGDFPIHQLDFNEKYRADFANVPPEVLKSSKLYILDELGNRIMVFTPGADGSFYFELLDVEDEGGLSLMENEDESSLLNVQVEGQVYEEEPGDIGKGEPIYIVDENGEVMALAYTTDQGKFRFDELTPDATYSFKLDENSEALNMVIYDGEEEIVIPVEEGSALYERVKEEEAVSLKNEDGEKITIRKDDLFIIQNIYYALNSSKLNAVARYQLDQLADIMVRNPDITIELGSHTDSRGEDDFNLRLSEERASTALDYMISEGISKSRMTAKGYGESVLLNGCGNDANCPEEEHALNRRTEIKIIVPSN